MFLSKANRFRFEPKILVRSKAIWFSLEIVLGKIERFYIIQKLIDRNKTVWFGPLIIGMKAKRFDLVRLLSELFKLFVVLQTWYIRHSEIFFIVFWSFLLVTLFLFFSSYLSSYSSLLIFKTVYCIADLHLNTHCVKVHK